MHRSHRFSLTPSLNRRYFNLNVGNVGNVGNVSTPVTVPALKLGLIRPGAGVAAAAAAIGGGNSSNEVLISQTSRPQSRGAVGGGDRGGVYVSPSINAVSSGAGAQSARLPEPVSMVQTQQVQTPAHFSYYMHQHPVAAAAAAAAASSDHHGPAPTGGQTVSTSTVGVVGPGPLTEGEVERPNTRRSRVRSRGGDRQTATPQDNKPGEGLIPTLPSETVSNSGFDTSVQPEIVVSQGGGGFMGVTIAPINLSSSNNNNNNNSSSSSSSSNNNSGNSSSNSKPSGDNAINLAYGVARAPDLPQRSGSSQGGRKGRNIVPVPVESSSASSSTQGVSAMIATNTGTGGVVSSGDQQSNAGETLAAADLHMPVSSNSNNNSSGNGGGGGGGGGNMNNTLLNNINKASPRDLALRNKNIAQGSIGAYGI